MLPMGCCVCLLSLCALPVSVQFLDVIVSPDLLLSLEDTAVRAMLLSAQNGFGKLVYGPFLVGMLVLSSGGAPGAYPDPLTGRCAHGRSRSQMLGGLRRGNVCTVQYLVCGPCNVVGSAYYPETKGQGAVTSP